MPADVDGATPPERYGSMTEGNAADEIHRAHLADRAGGQRPERLWFFALSMAFLGSLLGWTVGHEVAQHVRWVGKVRVRGREARVQLDGADIGGFLVSREEAERRNTALAMGILGGFLGLSAGMGGGLVRNMIPAAVRAGLCGLMLGAAAGVMGPWVMIPVYYRFLARGPNALLPVILHSLFYLMICGMAGLAFGHGLQGRSGAIRGGVAGAMGAVLGSIFFAVVHALAFPMEWDFSPMPGRTLSRGLAHLCVAVVAVTCAALALREETRDAVFEEAPRPRDQRSGPPRKAVW